MPSVIIVGATSGIGLALAKEMARAGYALGLAGRREDRLRHLQAELPTRVAAQVMDIRRPEDVRSGLASLREALGGMDVLVISAGISRRQATPAEEHEIVQTNVAGFLTLAREGFDLFARQGYGHLVGLSSISAVRGRGENAAYAASKAFVSNYLQGLRQSAFRRRLPITVTDVLPGWVDTPLIRGGSARRFWVAPADVAARQLLAAIRKKKSRVYITRRWRLIAWLLRWLPDWLHQRL